MKIFLIQNIKNLAVPQGWIFYTTNAMRNSIRVMQNKLYANTLSEMDNEINKLESSFDALINEFVVM